MSIAAPIYHCVKLPTKSSLETDQTQSVEEEKIWSQGPGNTGEAVGFTGAGAWKGVNLRGGASAFICIARMYSVQDGFNLPFQFIVDFS